MALMSLRPSLALAALWRAAWTLGLVAALLWAPVWGQWHGLAHQVQQPAAAPAVTAPAVDDVHAGHAPGSAQCWVLDHLGHANALSGWPLTADFGLLPTQPMAVQTPAVALMRPCWRLQARAPPSHA